MLLLALHIRSKEVTTAASDYSRKSYLNVEQFMRLAIDFEADSAAFYRSMQRPDLEDDVRGLLELLERQEREHERVLRDYEVDRSDLGILQFAPELSLSMPSPSQDPDFAELLRVAVAREEKSARIYRMTAEMTLGGFRQLLEELAGFEEEHENKLRRLQKAQGG
jgi:rubrerythrin